MQVENYSWLLCRKKLVLNVCIKISNVSFVSTLFLLLKDPTQRLCKPLKNVGYGKRIDEEIWREGKVQFV